MVLSARKKFVSAASIFLTATLLFGSTFAWQSISQETLGEIRGGINPGGRLHDDFTVIYALDNSRAATRKTYNKDVYVENFTNIDDGVQIYARVRLDEYMEIGSGAGTTGRSKAAASVIQGAEFTDTSTWKTYIPGETGGIRSYWDLGTDGGKTMYMPTFNKNKDSLAADINGTSTTGFTDYVDYSLEKNETKIAYAVYDNDDNDADEIGKKVADVISNGEQSQYYDENYIRIAQETHIAEETIDGDVMTMEEWLALDEDDKVGNFWVWDEDGWAYWASPILPGEATGLLLDDVKRTKTSILDEDGNETAEWYYGINVVAQLITAEDMGDETVGTGFYDTTKWTASAKEPTENALELLAEIGVNVDGKSGAKVNTVKKTDFTEVTTEEELIKAARNGGDITLGDDIVLSETVVIDEDTLLYLDGYDIYADDDFDGKALFEINNASSFDIEDAGCLEAPEKGYVAILNDNSTIWVWDGTFEGGKAVFYVDKGDVMILDGKFHGDLFDWDESNYERGLVYINVYDGIFYDEDPADINGESFVASGYTSEKDGDRYVIVSKGSDKDELPEEEEELPDEEEEELPKEDDGEEKEPEDKTDEPKEDIKEDKKDDVKEPEKETEKEPDDKADTSEKEEESTPSKPDEKEDVKEDSAKDETHTGSASMENSSGIGSTSGLSGKAESSDSVTEEESSSSDEGEGI